MSTTELKTEEAPATQQFAYSHYREEDFRNDGLRPFAKYRDFGFAKATNGLLQAHTLRFKPGYDASTSKRHYHNPRVQMVYLLKGWIKYEFDGHGEITMHPGSAWIQPPNVKHTVLGVSDDCELIEITVPVEYDTVEEN